LMLVLESPFDHRRLTIKLLYNRAVVLDYA
jgi:hypothetical protein